jgi:hypothetical protein
MLNFALPKKPTQAKDENEIAFGGVQGLLRRDEARDNGKATKTPNQEIKKPPQKSHKVAS